MNIILRGIMYIAIFAIGAVISFFFKVYKEKEQNNQICSSQVILYYNDIRANLNLDFMYTLKNKTGVITVSGTYFKDEKFLGSIRQDVSYVWTENKDNFNLVSTKINKIITSHPITDKELSYILPDFYVYPGKQITYTIVNQSSKGYMFTIGKRPVFFCSK